MMDFGVKTREKNAGLERESYLEYQKREKDDE